MRDIIKDLESNDKSETPEFVKKVLNAVIASVSPTSSDLLNNNSIDIKYIIIIYI